MDRTRNWDIWMDGLTDDGQPGNYMLPRFFWWSIISRVVKKTYAT